VLTRLAVRKLILLVVLVLVIGVPMCARLFDECIDDSYCDDGNPCTNDVCTYRERPGQDYDEGLCESAFENYCAYNEVDDGTPCDVYGEPGICESGECRVGGETPDGGV